VTEGKTMKIGKLVQRSIPAIFEYCETNEPTEFARLQDARYSKEAFDINYPFCKPVTKIEPNQHRRFWEKEYQVHGIFVRVTSQWFNPTTSESLSRFHNYLKQRGLSTVDDLASVTSSPTDPVSKNNGSRANPKHRNAIGNAQNLFVRYLLSSIADEDVSTQGWQEILSDFDNCCAYCGAQEKLSMDHIVPLNKQSLGQHCIGNLVPACRACNAKKAAKDFRDFLTGDTPKITAIETHMTKYGYEPNNDYEILRQIVDLAHQDVRLLADRYVKIIKTVQQDSK
jgi:hypothetical protein